MPRLGDRGGAVAVLEPTDLDERRRDATRRWARILGGPLKEVIVWTTEFQRLWDENFARLDEVLEEEKARERARGARRGRRGRL